MVTTGDGKHDVVKKPHESSWIHVKIPIECRLTNQECQSMAMTQEPIHWRYRFHICWAYILCLCKGISPQDIAKNIVLTYLHLLDPEDLPLK